jgi:acyl carrier protein
MHNKDVIKTYICTNFAPDINANDLADDCNLINSGLVDSLSLVRLIIWLEGEFNIPVSDMEIAPEDFNSVEKIDFFINKYAALTV